MNRRNLLTLVTLLPMAACGGDPPPPPPPPAAPPPPPAPTIVSLTLRAALDLNPDGTGTAKPLRVRILKMATGTAFAGADFFSIDQDPAAALGDDLKGTEELVMVPGAVQVWQAKLDDDVRVIGVMGAYQAIETAQWRAWKEVARNATTLLAAELGPTGLRLAEAAP